MLNTYRLLQLSLLVWTGSVSSQAVFKRHSDVNAVTADTTGSYTFVDKLGHLSEDHIEGAKHAVEFIAETLQHTRDTLGEPITEKLNAPAVHEKLDALVQSVRTQLFDIAGNDTLALMGAFAGQLLNTPSPDISANVDAGLHHQELAKYQHLHHTQKFIVTALDHTVMLFGGSSFKKLQAPDVQEKLKVLTNKTGASLYDMRKSIEPDVSEFHSRGIELFRRYGPLSELGTWANWKSALWEYKWVVGIYISFVILILYAIIELLVLIIKENKHQGDIRFYFFSF